MCACMCAMLLLLPRVLFFVHDRERESERAACVAPTERETEREVVLLLMCVRTQHEDGGRRDI